MPSRLPLRLHWVVNREDLAWAAGFADGEGSFHPTVDCRPSRKPHPRFEIGQSDIRALERFQKVLPFGAHVSGPYYLNHPRRAPHWRYYVNGFENVQALLSLLWTWLGPVKRQQAKSTLKECV